MSLTTVIAGFPGVGKSFLFNNDKNLIISDSDSSLFSWIVENGEKKRNPNFPDNYIEHIEARMDIMDYIFVSTHDVVRKALQDNNIQYTLVYPDRSLKNEYLERYKNRGNDGNFIKLFENKWDEFIEQMEAEEFPKKIKLTSGTYLKDVCSI